MPGNAAFPAVKENHNLQLWHSAVFDGILFSSGTRFTHRYPRHWHEELHFCAHTSGYGYFGYRGNSYLITAADFTITPPGEVHENWVDARGNISFRGAYIAPTAFRKAAELIGYSPSIPDCRDLVRRDAPLRRQFLAMHLSAERGDDQLVQEGLFLNFLHLFLSRCSQHPQADARLGDERSAVKLARDYIHENFTQSISLAALGRLTHLSPYHLNRVFCRSTGMPPHAYQTQVRVNRAKQLLCKRHPLSWVAASTGFADQSHLTRHFRRLVGVTPGRFLF